MDYTPQQIESIEIIFGGKRKQKPPDYSVKHKNLALYYARMWKSAAKTRRSRTLWFLILVLYVFFISIPLIQSLLFRFVLP